MSTGLPTRKAFTFGLKGILPFLRSLTFQNGSVLAVENPVKTRSDYTGHYSFFVLRRNIFPDKVSVKASVFNILSTLKNYYIIFETRKVNYIRMFTRF
jgi:hypothetical protein